MRRSWFDASATAHAASSTANSDDGGSAGPFSISAAKRLDSWQRAMSDGVIQAHEVAAQKARIVVLLRELEPMLDDAQHEKVTSLLEEWAVLQTMNGTLLIDELGQGIDSFQAAVPPDEGPSDC